jgi:GntR family transcriptional regulator, transcriptional repressor for pyruvate dehydrogenase complex
VVKLLVRPILTEKVTALFEPLEKESLTESIFYIIKNKIDEGSLKVGSRLPSERELASNFNVSRPALREAIAKLSIYGLIKTKPGDGNYIVDNFDKNFFSYMGVGSEITKDNYKDFFAVRRYFEEGIAQEAIYNVSNADIVTLKRINDKLNPKNESSINEAVNAEIRFHENYIELSKNALLVKLYGMIIQIFYSSASYVLQENSIKDEAYVSHKGIIDMLQKKDIEGCRDAVRYHLDISYNNLENFFCKDE